MDSSGEENDREASPEVRSKRTRTLSAKFRDTRKEEQLQSDMKDSKCNCVIHMHINKYFPIHLIMS